LRRTPPRRPDGGVARASARCGIARRRGARVRGRRPSVDSIQPGGLEVDVALHALDDVVVDDALVAEPEQRRLLGGEQLAHHALVRLGLLLDRAVVLVVEARAEPVGAKAELAAQTV